MKSLALAILITIPLCALVHATAVVAQTIAQHDPAYALPAIIKGYPIGADNSGVALYSDDSFSITTQYINGYSVCSCFVDDRPVLVNVTKQEASVYASGHGYMQ